MPNAKPEILISVDIESTGPIPAMHSMYQLGACVVCDTAKQFSADITLLNDNHDPKALEACHVTLNELRARGEPPKLVMTNFKHWIEEVTSSGASRPVFVAFNATFDWSFVNWYFHFFLGENPFGISGLDIKAYYAGMTGCNWGGTAKRNIDKQFRSSKRHTHNALDDAIEQAEIFEKMLRYNQQRV